MGKVDWSSWALRDLDHRLGWLDTSNPSDARRLVEEVARAVRLVPEELGLGFRLGRARLRAVLT